MNLKKDEFENEANLENKKIDKAPIDANHQSYNDVDFVESEPEIISEINNMENTSIIAIQEPNNIISTVGLCKRFIHKLLSNKKLLILIGGITIVLVFLILFSTHIICFHKWQPATCTLPKTCSICERTDGEALGHSEGDWETITIATLGKYGKKQQKCTVCGEILDTANIKKNAEITSTGYNFKVDELIEFINGSFSSKYSVSTESIDNKMYPIFKNGKYNNVSLAFKEDNNGYVSTIGVVASDNNEGLAVMIFIANNLFDGFIDTNNTATLGAFLVNKKYTSKGLQMSYASDGSMIIILLEPTNTGIDLYE